MRIKDFKQDNNNLLQCYMQVFELLLEPLRRANGEYCRTGNFNDVKTLPNLAIDYFR